MSVRDDYLDLRIATAYDGLYPAHRIKIPQNAPIKKFDDKDIGIFSLAYNVSVQVVDRVEDAVLKEIYDIAKKEGFNEVVVIDKQFVVDALRHETNSRIGRRRKQHDKI